MSRKRNFLSAQVVSNNTFLLSFQVLGYAVAFATLIMGLYGVTRFANSPFDVLIGSLATSTLAVALVTLAIVLPLSLTNLEAQADDAAKLK